ncbi:MAG: hypothetical protein CMJ81_03240 [Planctomycetaceae bacterium]|nr:hypothetical protein [Planctomycetaceae bacterium]
MFSRVDVPGNRLFPGWPDAVASIPKETDRGSFAAIPCVTYCENGLKTSDIRRVPEGLTFPPTNRHPLLSF